MENNILLVIIILEVAVGAGLLLLLLTRLKPGDSLKSESAAQGKGLGIGIPAGIGGGVAIGAAAGNIAIGILAGAAIGVSLGLLLGQFFMKEKPKVPNHTRPAEINFSKKTLIAGVIVCFAGLTVTLIFLVLKF